MARKNRVKQARPNKISMKVNIFEYLILDKNKFGSKGIL